MTTIRNPNVPSPVNAIEIDRAILDLQIKLISNLTWLSNGYGRAWKNLDVTQDRNRFYPGIYLGTQNNSERYTIAYPDTKKQGQCFFFVARNTVTEWQAGQYPFLNYDVGIIFTINLDLVSGNNLATEVELTNFIKEVRKVFIEQVLGVPYQLTLLNEEYLFESVFKEFQFKDQEVVEKAPFIHFRFNTTISLQAECDDLPFDRCTALLNNLTDEDIDCVCNVFNNTNSFELNGVAQYFEMPANAAYDLEHTAPLTITGWAKIPVFHNGVIYSKYNNNVPFIGFHVRINADGSLFFYMSAVLPDSVRVQTPAASVPLNTWFHYAFVYTAASSSSTDVSIYINGVAQALTVLSVGPILGSIKNSFIQKLGITDAIDLPFNGVMGPFRFWKVAQNAAFILDDANLIAGVTTPKGAEDATNLILEPNFSQGPLWQDIYVNWRVRDDSPIDLESVQTFNCTRPCRVTDRP